MPDFDISGRMFGSWEVLCKDDVQHGKRNSRWVCRCKCGTVRSVNRSSLVSGRSKSCGCIAQRKEGINATHGMSKTRLYREWASMRKRCKSETDKSASSYFHKGIRVCDEWEHDFASFRDWAVAHGYEDSMTIDRIDNSKGYSPDNCRWVLPEEQSRNRTNTVFVMYDGEAWCLRTLCEHIGFPYKLAHQRYRRLIKQGKCVDVSYIFAEVHTEKIAKRYRKKSEGG